MRAQAAGPRRPIEILHLAHAHFPADPRIKRETAALRTIGCRLAVIALRGSGQQPVERRDGVLVIRVPGHKPTGGPLSYLSEYAEFVWRCRRLVARHRAFSRLRVVHIHTLPDFLLWAALPASRRGARVVFDMHEILPEFSASKFPGVAGRLLARLARTVERWARRHADLTITVNRPIDELLATRPIGRPERRLIIHNTADPADFGDTPSPPADSRGGALDFIYHGTLTPLYGLDVAIRAIAQAHAAGIAARLTILGDGPAADALRNLTRRLGLDAALQFEAPIPQHSLPARLRQCAAGIVPTRLDGMTRYSLSTKLLEYVHLGIPVLAARLPSYQRYFDETTMWYWTAGDPSALAQAIEKFAAAPAAERTNRSQRALAAVAPLAWGREREALLVAYAELLASTGNRSAKTSAIRSAAVPSP